MGEVRWETEVEMSKVLDVYKVRLILEYDGNDDLGIEPGERISMMYLLGAQAELDIMISLLSVLV